MAAFLSIALGSSRQLISMFPPLLIFRFEPIIDPRPEATYDNFHDFLKLGFKFGAL